MSLTIYKTFLVLTLILLISLTSRAQIRYQLHKSRNETSWFAGINGGLTSFYGSLAVFNRDPLLKFQEESKFAFGITAGKSLSRFLSIRGYYTYGGFKAKNNDLQVLYDAKLNSYGGQFLVQLSTIIGRLDYVPDYAVYVIGGLGLSSTSPIISTIPTEDETTSQPIDSLNYATSVSAFDFNIGIGGSYAILNQVDVNIEVCYHITSSEELDLTPGNGKDKFLHLSVGAIYRFGFLGQNRSSGFRRR